MNIEKIDFILKRKKREVERKGSKEKMLGMASLFILSSGNKV